MYNVTKGCSSFHQYLFGGSFILVPANIANVSEGI